MTERRNHPNPSERSGAEHEPIAVVGLACRLPGAPDAPAYWTLLENGVDATREIPEDRWPVEAYYSPDPAAPGKMYIRRGGFIDRVYDFDAAFFGIAPREAVSIDPQQRLLLETAWHALEDGGIAPDRLEGTQTGVFIGISTNDYFQMACRSAAIGTIDPYTGTGTTASVAAGRVSYVLGLQGPNFPVDTACSSSLVAAHLACENLRRHECETAIVAGVNLLLAPEPMIYFCKLRALSPDGRCKTFDATADGYGRGEGCGAVVLKRLEDAQSQGLPIRAVIHGSAVNHDGRSSGLTVPNGASQEAVIRQALERAGCGPEDIQYVEAHGTGTPLGDPIELQALGAVHRTVRGSDNPVIIGSAKTNIGHLEAAAGVAGLIKVVLALEHRTIPAHLHFRQPNPYARWDELPIDIPTESRPWLNATGPRMAGLSSFGFSGTNAHLVLGEAPETPSPSPSIEPPGHILCLSAKTDEALHEFAAAAADSLGAAPDTDLADLCYTANTARGHFPHRLAVRGESRDEIYGALTAFTQDETSSSLTHGAVDTARPPKIVFLFSGHGAQYVNMGRELYETQPIFRQTMEECDALTHSYLDPPLLSVLYPNGSNGGSNGAGLDKLAYLQPVLFAFECAMARMWRSWGVEPAAVMGYSVGEYAAACVAGIMRMEDAAYFNTLSEPVQRGVQDGAMLTAFADEARVAKALTAYTDEVAIAAINGPRNVVISGAAGAVQQVATDLAAQGVRSLPLDVPLAFHSPLVEPMLGTLENASRDISYGRPELGFVSTMTGRFMSDEEVWPPEYWARHIREPVRFADGIRLLDGRGYDVFLEVGPQTTLLSMARQNVSDRGQLWLPSFRPNREPWCQVLTVLKELYVRGVEVDWSSFEQGAHRRYVPFPNYPFARLECTHPNMRSLQTPQRALFAGSPLDGGHPVLGVRLRSAVLSDIVYTRRVDVTTPSYLKDHQVYGMIVAAGASSVGMTLAALEESGLSEPYTLSDITFPEALILSDEDSRALQTILTPQEGGAYDFRVVSAPESEDGAWATHATGQARPLDDGDVGAAPPALETVQARSTDHNASSDNLYQKMSDRGLTYGPAFRWIGELWQGPREALARVCPPDSRGDPDGFVFHPGLIDAVFQLMAVALADEGFGRGVYIPVAVDEFRCYKRPTGPLWLYTHIPKGPSRDRTNFVGDIQLLDDSGALVAEVRGAHVRWAPREVLAHFTQQRIKDWLYLRRWMPADLLEAEESSSDAEDAAAGTWLIFADTGGIADALAECVRERGATPVLVYPAESDAGASGESAEHRVDPSDPARMESLCREMTCSEDSVVDGIVFLWSADDSVELQVTADRFASAQDVGARALLHLVQALSKVKTPVSPRLYVVSAGAQSIETEGGLLRCGHAPLWGLGRVVALEHPQLRCTLIDIEPDTPREQQADHLMAEIMPGNREDQVGYRGGQRFVARLARYSGGSGRRGKGPFPVDTEPYRLVRSEHGVLNELRLEFSPRGGPLSGEVEIRVHASSLNFRDVLNALNLYPGEAGPLGLECTGIVVAADQDSGFEPGRKVIALAPGCFSKYVNTDARLVVPLPEPLSWEEGATIPITFLTASYALEDLAQVRQGDKILIHAGAGGVGMAAIQIAQHAGAEVFATAGRPAKRELLQSLGVTHVYDSRSLEFAEQILEDTQGTGVDIVLNSLTGDYIPKSLSALAKGGRFVEIGKIDIWEPTQVAEMREDVQYHIFALDELLLDNPEAVGRRLEDLLPRFANGVLRPLPHTDFPILEASQAFQYMAQAKHTGKIVITHPATDEENAPTGGIREDAAYLITGGLGGLGLVVARWLVQKGARHLVLLGRRDPSEHALGVIADLERAGTAVTPVSADVSDRDSLERVFAAIDDGLPPLRGIFHAAGVLDDDTLVRLDWERFQAVAAPKTLGTLHLHALSQHRDLDHFVLFSSVAAVLGSPGQGNYAAGNAFQDAFALHRRAIGLPALSINWGPWSEIGMAAHAESEVRRQWTAMGIGSISPSMGIGALEFLLRSEAPNVGVMPIEWAKLLRLFPADRKPPLLDELVVDVRIGMAPSKEWLQFVDQLKAAPAAERKGMMIAHLKALAVEVLELDSSLDIDARAPLNELGFDSLMAVDLANQLGSAAGISLSATLLFDHPTLEALSGYLLENVVDPKDRGQAGKRQAVATPAPQPEPAPTAESAEYAAPADALGDTAEALIDSISEMTDEEVESLLDQGHTTEEREGV